MKTLSLVFGVAMGVTVAAEATAQSRRIVTSNIGTLYRLSGDTIWYERDTTVTRYVYRGDTIFTERAVNDRRIAAWTQVVFGDSLRYVAFDDPEDRVRRLGTAVHVRGGAFPRTMIISTMQMADSRARLSSATNRALGIQVPTAPTEQQAYCIDGSRTLAQHADTVRDIRVFPTRIDTTVYLFSGDTAVRRLSPAPRTFGYAMRETLNGEMYMSLLNRNSAQRNAMYDSVVPGKNLDRCNPPRR